jgi:hypothetical protein
VSELKKALDLLPEAPVVESRRLEYTQQFADGRPSWIRGLTPRIWRPAACSRI